MAEQYNSSHTGAIIDEKIQSLIDFGNIYEGHLSPGLLYENEQHQESIIDNRGNPIPGGGYEYEFDYAFEPQAVVCEVDGEYIMYVEGKRAVVERLN